MPETYSWIFISMTDLLSPKTIITNPATFQEDLSMDKISQGILATQLQ